MLIELPVRNSIVIAIRIIAVVLLGALGTGCTARKYEYAKSPYNLLLAQEKLIDTGSVYISHIRSAFGDTYIWYRFFSNGRLYEGNSNSYPTESQVNNLADSLFPGHKGQHYYRIDSNDVTLEIYLDPMNGFRYWTARISPDTLLVYKVRTSVSGKAKEDFRIFTRHPYRLTNHTANW